MEHRILYFLLLLVVLMGCKSKDNDAGVLNVGHNEETRKVIQSVIMEPQRREVMLDIVDSFDVEALAIVADVKEKREAIVLANANYDTTRAQLQQLYDEIGVELGQLGQSAKKHSLELRAHCSESEWKKILSHHHKPKKINYM